MNTLNCRQKYKKIPKQSTAEQHELYGFGTRPRDDEAKYIKFVVSTGLK